MQDLIERHKQYTTDEVDDWETGKSDEFFKRKGFYMDRKLGATMNGKPMFQFLLDKKLIKPLYKTYFKDRFGKEKVKHIAFIPAGFNKDKNDKLSEGDKLSDDELESLKGINPVQHRLAEGSALMSLLHVLVIPSLEYMRVFNAVTLPGKDYDFDDAKQCGEEALSELKKRGADKAGSLAFWLKQKGKLAVREGDMREGTVRPETARKHKMNIQHSFHVYGNNSIGYLHMHVYDGNLLTKAYDEMKGDSKNTPVDVVQRWVEEEEKKKLMEREQKEHKKKKNITLFKQMAGFGVHPTYELPPASKPKANTHPRFNNLRH